MDNEYIVADLECNKSAFYYSMGHSQEVVREVFRDVSGKLFIRFPNWGLVPLGKDTPEILIGKVPTSLELTTRISNLELNAKYLKDTIALTREKVEQEYFAQLEKLEIERNGLKRKLIEMTAECNTLDELLRESDKRRSQSREDRFAEIEGERDELKLDVERLEGMLDELDRSRRENTVLQGRLRDTALILIGEVGAEGPYDAQEAAARTVEHLQALKSDRDELERELRELKAKVSQWAVNHAWMLEEVDNSQKKEDIEKINRVISPPEGISISEWCKRTHIQLCHCCDDLTCDDNLRKELTEKENESKR